MTNQTKSALTIFGITLAIVITVYLANIGLVPILVGIYIGVAHNLSYMTEKSKKIVVNSIPWLVVAYMIYAYTVFMNL